jgi:hypothetical protein
MTLDFIQEAMTFDLPVQQWPIYLEMTLNFIQVAMTFDLSSNDLDIIQETLTFDLPV